MKFTPRDAGKLPRSNHDDLLEVQYLYLTQIDVLCQPAPAGPRCYGSSGWKLQNADTRCGITSVVPHHFDLHSACSRSRHVLSRRWKTKGRNHNALLKCSVDFDQGWPEVTPCVWRDVKIQELSNLFVSDDLQDRLCKTTPGITVLLSHTATSFSACSHAARARVTRFGSEALDWKEKELGL